MEFNPDSGNQEREWPGSEQDPDWCYVCDRPGDDCACELDPDGPLLQSACMRQTGGAHLRHKVSLRQQLTTHADVVIVPAGDEIRGQPSA